MVQIGALIKSAASQLCPSDSARLDSEILLAAVLRVDRASLYARANEAVPVPYICAFKGLLTQRIAGRPMAYIMGTKEFWSLDLKVNKHTLIPRPETECLVATALDLLEKNKCPLILELGTGSGAIAIAIAKERPDSQVVATDDDLNALDVAKINATNKHALNIRFVSCRWFEALRPVRVDMVISNPPYIAADDQHLMQDNLRFEPRHALIGGEDGLEALSHIIQNAVRYLSTGGLLILEHGFNQGRAVRALLATHRYRFINTVQDYAGLDRVSYAYYTY